MRLPLCSTAFQQACGEFNNLIIPAMLSKVNANTAFHPVVFCKLSQNQQNVFNNIVDSLGFSFPAWPGRHAGYPPAGGMVCIAPAQLRCSGGHNVRVTYQIQHGNIIIVIAKGHHIRRVNAQHTADALYANPLVGHGGIDPLGSRHGAVGLLHLGTKRSQTAPRRPPNRRTP